MFKWSAWLSDWYWWDKLDIIFIYFFLFSVIAFYLCSFVLGVSTSKATSVQTDETSASARQIPNDDLSKKLLSIWGSSNDSNEQELGRNVISNLLMDCQTDFLFLFGCIGINRMDKLGDDSSSIAASQYHLHMSHTPEAAKVSHLYSVLTKVLFNHEISFIRLSRIYFEIV